MRVSEGGSYAASLLPISPNTSTFPSLSYAIPWSRQTQAYALWRVLHLFPSLWCPNIPPMGERGVRLMFSLDLIPIALLLQAWLISLAFLLFCLSRYSNRSFSGGFSRIRRASDAHRLSQFSPLAFHRWYRSDILAPIRTWHIVPHVYREHPWMACPFHPRWGCSVIGVYDLGTNSWVVSSKLGYLGSQ